MAGIFWLSSGPVRGPDVGVDRIDLVAHAVVFGVLALLLHRAWRLRGWPRPALGPWLAATAYGLSDELHQAVVPSRDADPVDLLADALGAALALALARAVGRARARRAADAGRARSAADG